MTSEHSPRMIGGSSIFVLLLWLYVRSLANAKIKVPPPSLSETPTIDRPPVGNANPPLWPCPPSNAGKVGHIGCLSFST